MLVLFSLFENCSSLKLPISMKSLEPGARPDGSPLPATAVEGSAAAGKGAPCTPRGAEPEALLPPLMSRKLWVPDVSHSH